VDDIREWKRERDASIKRKVKHLEVLTLNSENIMLEDSHKMFLTCRSQLSIRGSSYVMSFISHDVKKLVSAELLSKSDTSIVTLWKNLGGVNIAAPLAGAVFESICHARFGKRISLKLSSMFGGGNNSYHAAFTDTSSTPLLHSVKQNAQLVSINVDFQPSRTEVYHESGIKLERMVYYRPAAGNEPALDAFLVDNTGTLNIFQYTGSKSHPINSKLLKALEIHTGVPDRSKWRFIFVLPEPVTTFVCKRPAKSIRFITKQLYTGCIKVERD
jgi:hypothetical protein